MNNHAFSLLEKAVVRISEQALTIQEKVSEVKSVPYLLALKIAAEKLEREAQEIRPELEFFAKYFTDVFPATEEEEKIGNLNRIAQEFILNSSINRCSKLERMKRVIEERIFKVVQSLN